jgi:hypothetical protein
MEFTREDYEQVKELLPHRLRKKAVADILNLDMYRQLTTKCVPYTTIYLEDFTPDGRRYDSVQELFKDVANKAEKCIEERRIASKWPIKYSIDYDGDLEILEEITELESDQKVFDRIKASINKFRKEDREHEKYLELKKRYETS